MDTRGKHVTERSKRHEVPGTIRGFLRATLAQIISQRRWMLLPLWVLLCVTGILLILSGNAHLVPVIYLGF